jgi:Tol biopolymer transport system component
MRSSSLSTSPMANKKKKTTIPYRFLLVVIGVMAIVTSSIFTMLPPPTTILSNQSPSAFATFPGENGKIVFSSIRDGNFEIYIMNADGSDQHNISNNPAQDAYPSWSPDGTKIAFS